MQKSKEQANPTNLNGEIDAELVLFDILGSANVAYYMPRQFDEELINNLKFSSIWVCGPSGWGKTSAIRYMLEMHDFKPLDICLSHCGVNSTKDDFIAEIIATANQLEMFGKNDRPATYHDLVTLLSEHSEISSIVLHLDEIPAPDEIAASISNLLSLISDLLNSVKQRTKRSNLRIIISSIYQPHFASKHNAEKLAEQLKIMPISAWSAYDLTNLLKLISLNIPKLSISEEQKMTLITSCRGNPRFVKRLIKNLLVTSQNKTDFDNALAKTESELVL